MSRAALRVISVFLLVAMLTVFHSKPAPAETVGIERALELLAKSTAIDAKCHVLSGPEREELARYTARAEVSAAEKTTVEVTTSSLSAGRKAGRSTPCSALASADVKDTLRAAREAIKSLSRNNKFASRPAQDLTPAEPAVSGSLASYGRITEAYFLERRCTYLSNQNISRFYKAVLGNHRAAMAKFGRNAVFQARKTAENRADRQKCDAAGRSRVEASFGAIASR